MMLGLVITRRKPHPPAFDCSRQVVVRQVEALVLEDRREAVVPLSAQMHRGIISQQANLICVESMVMVTLTKIEKKKHGGLQMDS